MQRSAGEFKAKRICVASVMAVVEYCDVISPNSMHKKAFSTSRQPGWLLDRKMMQSNQLKSRYESLSLEYA